LTWIISQITQPNRMLVTGCGHFESVPFKSLQKKMATVSESTEASIEKSERSWNTLAVWEASHRPRTTTTEKGLSFCFSHVLAEPCVRMIKVRRFRFLTCILLNTRILS
jgi:hypothetical protein